MRLRLGRYRERPYMVVIKRPDGYRDDKQAKSNKPGITSQAASRRLITRRTPGSFFHLQWRQLGRVRLRNSRRTLCSGTFLRFWHGVLEPLLFNIYKLGPQPMTPVYIRDGGWPLRTSFHLRAIITLSSARVKSLAYCCYRIPSNRGTTIPATPATPATLEPVRISAYTSLRRTIVGLFPVNKFVDNFVDNLG